MRTRLEAVLRVHEPAGDAQETLHPPADERDPERARQEADSESPARRAPRSACRVPVSLAGLRIRCSVRRPAALDIRFALSYSLVMETAARWLIAIGAIVLVAGLALLGAAKLGLPLGRLPGDIAIERDGFRFYFPLGTCLALSALLSLIAWLVARLR